MPFLYFFIALSLLGQNALNCQSLTADSRFFKSEKSDTINFNQINKNAYSILPEYLLISIRESYCKVLTYNQHGFLISLNNQSDFPYSEILRKIIAQDYSYSSTSIDSSQNIYLEMSRWDISNKSIPHFPLENQWIIVCYWTTHSAIDAQLSRMSELTLFQKHHPEIRITLFFVNQDFHH